MAQQTCKEDGSYLNKTENMIDTNCEFKCISIDCPNFLLCGQKLKKINLDCFDGLCRHCYVFFGKWNGSKDTLIFETKDCMICLEEQKLCTSLPKCEHFICINCFKRCFRYDNYVDLDDSDEDKNEPDYSEFPYSSDIEMKYIENPDDIIWKNDEKIIKYEKEQDIWNEWNDKREDKKQEKYEREENLRKCPLCRT